MHPHDAYTMHLCVCLDSDKTINYFQSDINGLVLLMATEYVSCKMESGILHKLLFILISYFKSFNATEIL
jgi:hypothetical protein